MWKVRIYHSEGSPKAIELEDVDDGRILPLDWESFAFCLNALKKIKNERNSKRKDNKV